MITIHYENTTTLIRAVRSFEVGINHLLILQILTAYVICIIKKDQEQVTRTVCFINPSVKLSFEVKVANVHTERVRIDPNVWGDIYHNVSELWVTVPRVDSVETRTISLSPISNAINEGQTVTIKVHSGATIKTVKHKFKQTLPQYENASLNIWIIGRYPCEVANRVSDDDLATRDQYHIGVDSLSTPSVEQQPESGSRNPFRRDNALPSLSGLLVMHHSNPLINAVLTTWYNRYEDLEESARLAFSIDKNISIVIMARISTMHNQKARIEPRIWEKVNKDISEIWILTHTPPPTHKIVKLESVPHRKSPSLLVKVDEGATILDVKLALSRAYGSSPSHTIRIYGSDGAIQDDTWVLGSSYKYYALCAKCQNAKNFWWLRSSLTMYYAVPDHKCLDPMSKEESDLHDDSQQPHWIANALLWIWTIVWFPIYYPCVLWDSAAQELIQTPQ
ncbi:hypothetical protein M408DRAFT_310387 [Serendipita vermifera MAFF 305830]|uniref:Uncharacterized protein n=1 Tax=Serendipita vermifera MAFF 305830 TaxID=933852 RepID=A0A0C3A628_SERVB|nr:hypothetical protein M408DRAFT_310387 [Serendipita vermifera MAFF 305830]